MDLNELQSEVAQWSNQNFGSQPPSYPLVGSIEEIGELSEAYLKQHEEAGIEGGKTQTGFGDRVFLILALQAEIGRLAHSVLKRTQGIREDDETVGVEAEKEFIAVSRMILKDLHETVDDSHESREIKPGDPRPEPTPELIDAVADTNIYLADFSQRAGIDMGASVQDTWEGIVSDRDWDSDLGDA